MSARLGPRFERAWYRRADEHGSIMGGHPLSVFNPVAESQRIPVVVQCLLYYECVTFFVPSLKRTLLKRLLGRV